MIASKFRSSCSSLNAKIWKIKKKLFLSGVASYTTTNEFSIQIFNSQHNRLELRKRSNQLCFLLSLICLQKRQNELSSPKMFVWCTRINDSDKITWKTYLAYDFMGNICNVAKIRANRKKENRFDLFYSLDVATQHQIFDIERIIIMPLKM